MTDAPEAPDSTATSTDAPVTTIDGLVADWRAELDGQVSVPASTVQDHLLALWGELPEGDARSRVERWLTETLQRNLYQVDDIDARLAGVLPAAD